MGKVALRQALSHVLGCLTAIGSYCPTGPGTVGALLVAALPRGLGARHPKLNSKVFGSEVY
jgi:hypothetical protein